MAADADPTPVWLCLWVRVEKISAVKLKQPGIDVGTGGTP